jgi:hypothetical protein
MKYSASTRARLWNKISLCEHGKGCKECCWPWKGARTWQGYGKIAPLNGHYYITRVMWELKNKRDFPSDLFALHTCDNPPCCNPWHLYAGTKAQNALDAKERGRVFKGKGTLNGRALLTARQVNGIRFLYACGDYTLKELAEKYGVSKSTIHHIVIYMIWPDLPFTLE